jgi:hypothetical protein
VVCPRSHPASLFFARNLTPPPHCVRCGES